MTDPARALVQALSAHAVHRLGVAVSGGGDSAAALVLAVEALGPARVAAVTVDHGLRPESRAEAEGVGALAARLGVTHDILRWTQAPGGNLQDAARRARRALIADWAVGHVDAVLLAHTLEDQAETLLMRLARGSGVDGLAAMRPARHALNVLWLRPFLDVPRAALRAVLVARGLEWVEDPSNADPRFARVRARQAMAALGLDAARLGATARAMAAAQTVLETQADAALTRLAQETGGAVRLDRAVFDLPQDTMDRLFARLVMGLSGATYRPRGADLHRLIAAARAGQGATLGGVMLHPGLWLSREPRAVTGLRVPVGQVWDGRWRATGPDAEIAALGAQGLADLARLARDGQAPHPRETGLPRGAVAAQPAIWRGERLVSAPLAGWAPTGWTLTADPLLPSVTDLSH
jgi:tRNA(Ile)-lysidine synthase